MIAAIFVSASGRAARRAWCVLCEDVKCGLGGAYARLPAAVA
jgi:hypothetical protein